MFSLGRGRRIRLSGIFASIIQIAVGGIFVSKFFKDEPLWVGWFIALLTLLFIILSVIIEPPDEPNKKGA